MPNCNQSDTKNQILKNQGEAPNKVMGQGQSSSCELNLSQELNDIRAHIKIGPTLFPKNR